jgi:hypothetical protein
MTDHSRTLSSAAYVGACAKVASDKPFDIKVCGVEFMKHGYAMLSGQPYDIHGVEVGEMLKLYEACTAIPAVAKN